MSAVAAIAGLRHRPALLLLIILALPAVVVLALFIALTVTLDVGAAVLIVAFAIGSAALVILLVRAFARGSIRLPLAIACLVWGGLAAPVIAFVATVPWSSVLAGSIGDPSTPWSDAIIAGPIEEPSKLLGLALVATAWPGSVGGARAGLLAGMLVGLGFGTTEHLVFATQLATVRTDLGGPSETVAWIFLARVLGSGLFLHVGFTGLTGAAVGWAMSGPSALRWLAVAATLAAVAGLHAFANAGPIAPPLLPWTAEDIGAVVVASLVRSLPFLLVVGLLVRLGAAPRVRPEPTPVPEARSAP